MPPHLITPSQISAFPAQLQVRRLSSHRFVIPSLNSIPLQRAARLAADVSTPLTFLADALRDIRRVCFQATDSGRESLLSLLSLIYGLLDPTRLPPEPNTVDTDIVFYQSILCAFEMLQLFSFLIGQNTNILPKIGRVFWPRLWCWSQLMESHNHYTDTFPGSPRFPILEMAGLFWKTECISEFAIRNTPGLGTFLAHVWDDIISVWGERPGGSSILYKLSLYAAITDFLRICHHSGSHELFGSIVDGAGGPDKIAAVLIKYISLLIADAEHVPLERPTLMNFLANILLFLCDGQSLWHSLVRAGYTRFITKVVIKLTEGPWTADQLIKEAVVSCLRHLASIISLNDEYVRRALRANLFTALCCFLRMDIAQDKHEVVTQILDTVAQATLHYPSLRTLASIFPALETVDAAGTRSFSGIYQAEWTTFITLARMRVRLLNQFRSKKISSIAACANPECKILNIKRTGLRRCAGCKLALYCSKKCQTMSWRIYNHRSICAGACSENASEYRSTRFLHFAILREYHAQKSNLILKELAYANFTGRKAFCLLFRYIAGRFSASVVFADSYKKTIENHPTAGLPSVEMHLVDLPKQPIYAIALRTSGRVSMKERILQTVQKISSAKFEDAAKDLARLEVVETYDGDANV
ncbi:hypothetical protein R3P38DRAFT_2655538 [Favolaschia claudopus]|uniref:MYND-type domain-containing protein n=1 Tax=Favolaschia claudopus TaxID=2862362 RepID=A0AAV9ZZ56_9AGAR